ncbi:Protein CBG26244 [Caenorhabditis briggsae]|uniref:Protein CBG26244 n=1 Tax=Caenorhabditis briggsae TaxID=6238 RepID=B6ILW5_CAEBR|nr:Protein CBG26244 [Caenorhabditis briggsae]CAS00895.1 Protein CBG26244 [Caenorhabditis briggsae]
MKFLSLFVLTQIVSSLAQSKLSIKENLERLENCGKENPFQPTDTTWLWLAASTDTSKQFLSTASMISNRHFLLSAYVLIDEKMNWRINGDSLTEHCIDGTENSRIPDDFVKHIVFRPPECYKISNTKCDSIKVSPTKGYVLKACSTSIRSPLYFEQRYTQMIVEFEILDKINHTYNYPCLVNPRDHNAVDGWATKYAFNSENEPMIFREEPCVIQGFGSFFPCGPHYDKDVQGSVLIKQLNVTKWTIVGMGSTGYYRPDTKQSILLSMEYFYRDICSAAGVCSFEDTPSIPETTTTSESTNSESQTSLTPSESTPTSFWTSESSTSSSTLPFTSSEHSTPPPEDPPEDPPEESNAQKTEDIFFYLYRQVESRKESHYRNSSENQKFWILLMIYFWFSC